MPDTVHVVSATSVYADDTRTTTHQLAMCGENLGPYDDIPKIHPVGNYTTPTAPAANRVTCQACRDRCGYGEREPVTIWYSDTDGSPAYDEQSADVVDVWLFGDHVVTLTRYQSTGRWVDVSPADVADDTPLWRDVDTWLTDHHHVAS